MFFQSFEVEKILCAFLCVCRRGHVVVWPDAPVVDANPRSEPTVPRNCDIPNPQVDFTRECSCACLNVDASRIRSLCSIMSNGTVIFFFFLVTMSESRRKKGGKEAAAHKSIQKAQFVDASQTMGKSYG